MSRTIERQTDIKEKIDPNTGQVTQVDTRKVETLVLGSPGKSMDINFVKVFPAFFSSFLQDLKIDDGKARLVLYLIHKAIELKSDSDNVIFADNDELMKSLNISKPTLIRYIADLCALNIIERLKPRMPIYRINPNMIYKGTLTKYYKKYIEEHIKV